MFVHSYVLVGLACAIGVALVIAAGRSLLAARRQRVLCQAMMSWRSRETSAVGEPTVYDKALVYINGKILGQAESVNVDVECKRAAADAPIKTLRARVVSFIPQSGFEFDAVAALADEAKVELKLRFGVSGATLISNGRSAYASVVSSAKDISRLEFEFNGAPAVFVPQSHPLVDATRAMNEAADAIAKAS